MAIQLNEDYADFPAGHAEANSTTRTARKHNATREICLSPMEVKDQLLDTRSVRDYLLQLQQRIVTALENIDGELFISDDWQKEPTEPLRGQWPFAHARRRPGIRARGRGVFPCARRHDAASATAARPATAGRGFEALGVSLVFHPRNPYCPTVHMNVRLFIAQQEGAEPVILVWRRDGPDAVLRLRRRCPAFSWRVPRCPWRHLGKPCTRASKNGATSIFT